LLRTQDVLEDNRRIVNEISAKRVPINALRGISAPRTELAFTNAWLCSRQNEIDVSLRRIRSCGEGVPDAVKLMLDHKEHIIELLQQQVHKLQQLSMLQYEALARIPHATRHTAQQLHQFGSYNTQSSPPRTSQREVQVESCTSSDS
jgi:hypothetical protein